MLYSRKRRRKESSHTVARPSESGRNNGKVLPIMFSRCYGSLTGLWKGPKYHTVPVPLEGHIKLIEQAVIP